MSLVNPERLTKFDRNEEELFRFLFFSVAVAGKTAKQIAIKVNAFFEGRSWARYYLSTLVEEKRLRGALEAQRMGKYNTLERFVEDYLRSSLMLSFCSVEDLEKLHGVGPKTARMFLLHSRPNQRFAVLDTHVLKFLQEKFPEVTIPKATPSGKKYQELENLWLTYLEKAIERNAVAIDTCSKGEIVCKYDKDGKLDIAAFDLDLWRLYSGNQDDYVD